MHWTFRARLEQVAQEPILEAANACSSATEWEEMYHVPITQQPQRWAIRRSSDTSVVCSRVSAKENLVRTSMREYPLGVCFQFAQVTYDG